MRSVPDENCRENQKESYVQLLFQMKIVEKMKRNAMCNNFYFRKLCHLCDNIEKFGGATEAINVNKI
jgi:hypothetical protein